MAEIYTKSVIKIGDETFRNLPAQVDRDQEVSYDANLKSQQAISTANAAQAKANEAKAAADAAQSTADAAQAKANEAKTAADSATGLATQVQGELANSLESKVVRYDETQLLSEDQMITARGNIEAAPITGTVRYDINQSLTDEQKTKAKTNIGVNTDIDTINDTLENKVVRADKKQNLNYDYKKQARDNIDAVNTALASATAKSYIDSYAVVYREPFENRTQTLTDAQQQKVRTAISAPKDADVVKVIPQTLTDEQKAQARANIGAGTGGGSTEGAVLYNQVQTLTDEQKAQARANIGAGTGGGGGSTEGAVLYTQSQSLTDEQKVQARTNIGVEGAILYSQAQNLTDQQKSQARTNIDAAPANIDYVRYNSYQSLSKLQKDQACDNIDAASGHIAVAVNTPNISAIETKTVDDYTVLEYIFDAQYDAQNRYTTNYDMTLFVIHNNQSLNSSDITATLYEGYLPNSGNVEYNKVAEMLVPGTNKTFAIGCFRNRIYKFVQPVYSINATNLNCQVALGIANFNITESSPNTSYATPSPAAFDLINKGGNNQIYYKLVFSGINDDTVISRFGGFYNGNY